MVATKPVDFRKGAEGLAALRETIGANPFLCVDEIMRRSRTGATWPRPVRILSPHNIWYVFDGRGIPLRHHLEGYMLAFKRLRSGAPGREMDRLAKHFFTPGCERGPAKIYLSRFARCHDALWSNADPSGGP